MREEETALEGASGNRLAATLYRPDVMSDGAPAVLFMHGGGQTRHSWGRAARNVAARGLLAITVDARGHGESDWVDDADYTFSAFRDDLRAVASTVGEMAGGRPPVLVGASMGGIAGMLAQERDTGDDPVFSGIVLVDITPRMERSGVDKIMGFMAENVEDGFATVEEAADTVAAYLPDRPRPSSLNGLRKNLRQRQDGRWVWHWDPAFVKGHRHVGIGVEGREKVLNEAVAAIDVPTLLVRGGKSELVSMDAVEDFLRQVPHAKFVDVSQAGHMVAGDDNDAFTEAVIDFLQEEVFTTR